MRRQLVDGVAAGGHGDGGDAERGAALDVGRRVADDHDVLAGVAPAVQRLGAGDGDGRQVGAQRRVRAVGADLEEREEARRLELETGPLHHVAGEQADEGAAVGGERRHQLLDARQRLDLHPGDLVAQQFDVARDAVVDEPVDRAGRDAETLRQVVDDLGLRLALVPADHLARLAAAPQLGEVAR